MIICVLGNGPRGRTWFFSSSQWRSISQENWRKVRTEDLQANSEWQDAHGSLAELLGNRISWLHLYQEMKTECDILAENDHPFILCLGFSLPALPQLHTATLLHMVWCLSGTWSPCLRRRPMWACSRRFWLEVNYGQPCESCRWCCPERHGTRWCQRMFWILFFVGHINQHIFSIFSSDLPWFEHVFCTQSGLIRSYNVF